MRLISSAATALIAALALTGCGGGGGGAGSAAGDQSGTATEASAGGLLSRGWKGDEACTTLSKNTVAKAAGIAVTETKLDGVFTTTDTPSNVSSCFYTLKSGGIIDVLTKETPDSDNTAESMKAMRDQVAGMMGPAEDVTGVGKGAFWLPKARQLNAFVGKDRYFNVTVPADLGGKDPKAVALAIGSELD
jgi:hypothetical protein